MLGLVVCTCYSSNSLQRLYTNTFLTVSNHVSPSVATVGMLTFTTPPSRSSVAILRDLTRNSHHYLRNAPSIQEIVHKDQYTSHLQNKSAQNSIAATQSWSILLTNYGATWFMLILHLAPLALGTYMLVYFCILWHKLLTSVECFDITQCQYLPCGTHNHTLTNTCGDTSTLNKITTVYLSILTSVLEAVCTAAGPQ